MMKSIGNGIDTRATLFVDGGEIVRVVAPEWCAFYQGLDQDRTYKDLAKEKLLASTSCSLNQANQSLQIRQPILPFVSYPHEWSPEMMREAALSCLRLHRNLFERNLCLTDSHGWNLVFDGASPLWVDVTSIGPYCGDTVSGSLQQFEESFVNALRLLSLGHDEVVRAVISHTFQYIDRPLTDSMCTRSLPDASRLTRMVSTLSHAAEIPLRRANGLLAKRKFNSYKFKQPSEAIAATDYLQKLVSEIDITAKTEGWTDYIQAGLEPLLKEEVSSNSFSYHRFENLKFDSVHKILVNVREECDSVVDLACNKGLFTHVAHLIGFRSAGMDIDPGAIDEMQRLTGELELNVNAAVNDIVSPREAGGMLVNQLPDFSERFSADCVLCLALVHHLYFGKYQMDFFRISDLMTYYTKKILVVEFVPPDDSYLRENYENQSRYETYTEENFLAGMSTNFNVVESKPSFPDGRALWVMHKLQK